MVPETKKGDAGGAVIGNNGAPSSSGFSSGLLLQGSEQ